MSIQKLITLNILFSLYAHEIIPVYVEICDINTTCEKIIKLLGITVDDKFKFDKQVDILCKKAAEQIHVLYKCKHIFWYSRKGNHI